MYKVTGFLFFLMLASAMAFAQSYEVPKDYVLKTNADYERYEPEVIKTADWLQQTPWSSSPQKMDAATQFLLKWAKGSPAVTIKLTEAVMSLSDRNPQLGFIYMAQFSKYALQHKRDFDLNSANVIALKALIDKYNNEPKKHKDNDVEHLIALEKKGELNDWIAAAFYTE
jgi:hypothetical protein